MLEQSKESDILTVMTVCIAAIADNGKKLVIASDNMLTIPIGNNIQYQREDKEHKKIYRLNNNTFALTAGTTSFCDSIIKEARKNIGPNAKPANVAEQVKTAYQDFYKGQIEDAILKKNGLNWNTFINEQKKLDSQFVATITGQINNFQTNESIIVAGYNKEDSDAYIGSIIGFTLWDRTTESFFTNGSGGELAKFSMILSEYNKTLPADKVKILVEKAVKDSSKSPGVGELGEIIVIPD